MNSIKVLDVTLRDGGCVNNFNFGTSYINRILSAQENSGVDIIELGYLDSRDGSRSERTQYIDEKVIYQSVLRKKKHGVEYVAMMDYGKFDVDKLENRNDNGIDGIRLAFHKANKMDVIPLCKSIMNKGYKLYFQPMVTLRYSDVELIELIQEVNRNLPDASGFYIVDSFGEMRANDMSRILNLVDHNLIPTMKIGFHSHNNLQMSYSNAIAMLQHQTNRDFIIDSSIMGMGKGAGNLNTELLLEHLNIFYGKNYNISPLLEVIDTVINQIHAEFYWGYAPEYYLSAVNHCTPSYASYFYSKHMLPIEQISDLLRLIDDNKKLSFDSAYAEDLYRLYNENKSINDTETLKILHQLFGGKTVLLVAPGKSMLLAENMVKDIANRDDVIAIGVNTMFEFNEYIIATRKDIFTKAVEDNRKLIVPSNITRTMRDNVKIVNYANWIDVDEKTHDSSTVIALKLLSYCQAEKVLMAGFDGFSMDMNKNYHDGDLRHPMTSYQAEEENKYYKNFIKKMMQEGLNIEFITDSLFIST